MSDELCPLCEYEYDDEPEPPTPETPPVSTPQAAAEGIGSLIPAGADPRRDAIHVAIFPADAGEKLHPGQRIAVGRDGVAIPGSSTAPAIVDPFLGAPVYPRERFWAFMAPGSITSLRHEWTHPAFDGSPEPPTQPQPPDTGPSFRWIEMFARNLDLERDELMEAARGWIDRGDYLFGGSNLEGERIPDEFWDHYATVTGRPVKPEDRDNFFRCSC